jgi:hypothetical protein
MRFFELEDRAVALFNPNNALVFDGDMWRLASVLTARTALTNGTELTYRELWAVFPSAAKSLPLDSED